MTTPRPTTRRRVLAGVLAAVLVTGAAAGLAAASAATAAAVTPAATPAAASAPAQPGWLHTKGATIVDANNAVFTIKAVSWFGLETSNCMPHGLWTLNLDATVKQIKGFGFNTIRLPYANQCLTTSRPDSLNEAANPGLVGKTPLQIMDAVVASAKANGLNVILDRHRPDTGGQSELWYTGAYPEKTWIADWTMLATRYRAATNVIGFDLHNEPHGTATWGSGVAATDWKAAATRAGNAIQAVNPKLLIIVEGVEVQSGDDYTWWGGGLKDAKSKLVTLATPNQVVYSPHEYPASVYAQKWFSAANYPANLAAVWDKNWGYLVKQDVAPVWVGEFGTKLETASDKQWLSTFVSYVKANGISWSYWSFNPNSGDTGGLVKADWRTPETAKLTALAPLFAAGGSTGPVPTATPKPTASATPKPTASATPTPTTPPVSTAALTATWKPGSSWAAGYVATIDLTAKSAVKSWTISWQDAAVTKIANAWGMTCTVVVKKSITCTGSDYATTIAKGAMVSPGLQVDSTVTPRAPTLTLTSK